MDLENLNKTQIVLLTLLVSFVTSIATGIVTVALMSQTPPAVTQTINRVVERTVERVVPAAVTDAGGKGAATVEKETTVVVKEDDLITESIAKNKQFIVRLGTADEPAATNNTIEGGGDTTASSTGATTTYTFEGMGVIASGRGLVATAASVGETSGIVAVTADGVAYQTTLVSSDGSIALLKLLPSTNGGTVALKAATFADTNSLKLGQTVIALSGEGRTSVGIGIIASLIPGDSTTTPLLAGVETNIETMTKGSPLVNIFGEVVGIRGDEPDDASTFTSSGVIKAAMAALIQKPAADTAGDATATTSAATETENNS